jgi:hypothetical protein
VTLTTGSHYEISPETQKSRCQDFTPKDSDLVEHGIVWLSDPRRIQENLGIYGQF